MSCSDIGTVEGMPVAGLQASVILMKLASISFSLFNISWASISKACIFLAALVSLLSYLILRQFAAPILALSITTLVFLYPEHLDEIKNFRDYSKAPAILLSILLMVIALKQNRISRYLLLLASVGASMAIGQALRGDVLILFPPLVLAIFLLSKPFAKRDLYSSLSGVLVMIFAFFLTSSLVMAGVDRVEEAGSFAHVFYLGLADQFWYALDVTPRVGLLAYYSDGVVASTVATYSRQNGFTEETLQYLGGLYGKVSLQAYLSAWFIFTEDLLRLGQTAMLSVLSFPKLLFVDSEGAPFLLGGLLFAASILKPAKARLFGVIMICLAYIGFAQVLQFHSRHYFIYKILVLMAICALIIYTSGLCCRKIAAYYSRNETPSLNFSSIDKSTAIIWGVNGLILCSGLWLGIFSVWQDRQISSLAAAYQSAALVELSADVRPEGGQLKHANGGSSLHFRQGFLSPYTGWNGYAFEVRDPNCLGRLVTVGSSINGHSSSVGFVTNQPGRLYLWAHNYNDINISPQNCISNAQMIGKREHLPAIVNFFLADDGGLGQAGADRLVALRPVQKSGDHAAEKSCRTISEAQVSLDAMQENVKIGEDGVILIEGKIAAPKGYLVRIKPSAKARLSLEGVMNAGLLALSVLDETQSAWVENSLFGIYQNEEYFSYIRDVEAHQALIVSSNVVSSGDEIDAKMVVRHCE